MDDFDSLISCDADCAVQLGGEQYFWDVDNNGVRNAELRFYSQDYLDSLVRGTGCTWLDGTTRSIDKRPTAQLYSTLFTTLLSPSEPNNWIAIASQTHIFYLSGPLYNSLETIAHLFLVPFSLALNNVQLGTHSILPTTDSNCIC